jgi:hypothetical protein
MDNLAALLRARSVRFLRLDPGHATPRRPRGFQPWLEDLETRVVPSGGATQGLQAHLADAARVSTANTDGASNDQLDAFWGGGNQAATTNLAATPQTKPANTTGQIHAFSTVNTANSTGSLNLAVLALPTVTVTNPDPFASEDPTAPAGTPETTDTAFFLISRSGGSAEGAGVDNSQPLTVFFTLGGSAVNGVDFASVPDSATIPAGQDSVMVVIVPLSRLPQGPIPLVDVTLSLNQSENYVTGTEDNALVVIFQDARFPASGGSGGNSGGSGGNSGGSGGSGGNSGGTPPPVIVKPPLVPPVILPTLPTEPQESIALGSGSKKIGLLTPPPETRQSIVAGLPLDPALRDRPGGLLAPQRADEIALVGGTNAVGQISGKIFDDVNGTGSADNFKPGLPGVTVFLDLNDNGVIDHGEPTTTTNSNGEYSFTGLVAGTYIVRQAMPGNVLQTLPANEAPYEVRLERITDAGTATDLNFGLQLLSGRGRPVGTPARRLPPAPAVKPTPSSSPGNSDGDGEVDVPDDGDEQE